MNVEQNNEKTNKKLLTKSIAGLSFFCLVFFTAIWVFATQTFGWFSQSDNANANGINLTPDGLKISAEYYVIEKDGTETEITAWDKIFENIFPGDEITLKVVYNNLMNESYSSTVYLAPYDDGEIPLVKNNGTTDEYYYLGSQIKVVGSTAKSGDNEVIDGLFGEYLVKNDDENVFFENAQTISNTVIATGVFLPAAVVGSDGTVTAGTLTVTVTLQFVNFSDKDQNAYQGFGALVEGDAGYPNGKCYRYVVMDLYS